MNFETVQSLLINYMAHACNFKLAGILITDPILRKLNLNYFRGYELFTDYGTHLSFIFRLNISFSCQFCAETHLEYLYP